MNKDKVKFLQIKQDPIRQKCSQKHIKTFEYQFHWNINIRENELLYGKINDSVAWNRLSGDQINQKSSNTMSVMLCPGAIL